jgi:hypothetical protein
VSPPFMFLVWRSCWFGALVMLGETVINYGIIENGNNLIKCIYLEINILTTMN